MTLPLMYCYCRQYRCHVLYHAKSNTNFPALSLWNENFSIKNSTEYIFEESGIWITIESELQCYSSTSFQVINKELLHAITFLLQVKYKTHKFLRSYRLYTENEMYALLCTLKFAKFYQGSVPKYHLLSRNIITHIQYRNKINEC
jgi:hypothetical protein